MITKGEMPASAVKGFEGENKKRSWAGKGMDFLNLSVTKLRKGFKMLQQGGVLAMANESQSKKIEGALNVGPARDLEDIRAKLASFRGAPEANAVKIPNVAKRPIGKAVER